MKTLTTAVVGLTLMLGSAFAAAPQTDSAKTTDSTAAPTATKTTKAKKHKKAKKPAADATTPAAAPTK